jgi:hypothetical protein
MSFSLVGTGVPREKPLQAKLRADYFSLSLFLYLQCLKKAHFEVEFEFETANFQSRSCLVDAAEVLHFSACTQLQ